MVRYIAPLLFLSLLLSAPSEAEAKQVYVGNQRMVIDSGTGAVSVIHFIRLLDQAERERVRLEGQTLVVEDAEGKSHPLPLDPARRLVAWEAALGLLGYMRKENAATGVVDYRTAVAVDERSERDPGSEEERREHSMRRPAYRQARKNFELILSKIPPAEDQQTRRRVQRLGRQIASVSPLGNLDWRFEVIDTPVPNALCTGEGHVIVTTGLLDLNLTDDELAGVLGHEVAHGVRRHAQIYEERFNEYLTLRSELLRLSQKYEQAVEADDKYQIQRLKSRGLELTKRYNFVLDYLKKKRDYDQDEEEESDVLGMQYAAAAGFDPMGEARALIKLRERSVELFGQAYSESDRTHPPLERRLMILETVRARWQRERRR